MQTALNETGIVTLREKWETQNVRQTAPLEEAGMTYVRQEVAKAEALQLKPPRPPERAKCLLPCPNHTTWIKPGQGSWNRR